MPQSDSQTFLRELDKKLWTAADRLRSNLDAAVCKHAVFGLIFLKYVSDSFAQRQAEIREQLTDPKSDYFIDPVAADCIRHAKTPSSSSEAYEELIRAELEERDYYIEKNVFWVPALARIGTVAKAWTEKFGVVIESGTLRVGDQIAVEFAVEYEIITVESIRANDKEVESVTVGDPAGLP